MRRDVACFKNAAPNLNNVATGSRAVKRAIVIHRTDFIAIVALVVIAMAVVIYILEHQPAFTLGKSYYTVKAQFPTGAAVTAGQGQSVDIAGVQVGQVGGVKLEDGRAVVTMNIFKKYQPIYHDATVLLRPRTPLKDMYLALDPGTRDRRARCPTAACSRVGDQPRHQRRPDPVLARRRHPQLPAAAALGRRGGVPEPRGKGAAPSPSAVRDLRGVFKRFAPLNRDTQTFTRLLAQRQRNISRSIHNLQVVTKSLGSVDGQLTSLINSSNTNFSGDLLAGRKPPAGADAAAGDAAADHADAGQGRRRSPIRARPTLHALLPFAHAFGPALPASRPLFKDTTPVIKNQLRPFSVAVQPLAKAPRARQRRAARRHAAAGPVASAC